jgi:HAD superfamily hydrolase (TIGR01509 family)
VNKLKAAVFDWGDTVMRDFPEYKGPMAEWPHVETIEGIQDTLARLYPETTCCLASNAEDSDADLMGKALERASLRQYFRYLFTSKELGAKKPDPAFYTSILEVLKLKPRECIAIGNDYEKDIVPAKSAGMRTVWFHPNHNGKSAPAADFTIKSLKELVPVVESIKN